MQIQSVGIDLGKTTFHLVALGAAGKLLVKKKFTQKQLLAYTANLQTSLIGLEACAGGSLSRASVAPAGPRCPADPGTVRQAVCGVEQERLRGCRGLLPKLSIARTCALFRSRPTTSWTCRRFTGCATDWSHDVLP